MSKEFAAHREKGMALVTALLAMTILLTLGTAVIFSAVTDTITTKTQRTGEQSFFVADAGIGIARRALSQALNEEIEKIRTGETPFYSKPAIQAGSFPDVQVVPDPDLVPNDPFYQRVNARAQELTQVAARNDRFQQLNGSAFTITFKPLTGSVSLIKQDATHATQAIVFRYAIQVKGKTDAGGSAQVNEVGRLSANVNMVIGSSSSSTRDLSFSAFGTFFDRGDDAGLNYVLVPGVYSGLVHTNTHLAFYSKWQYTFRNQVSQVDPKIRYIVSTNNMGNYIDIPNSSVTGINLSTEGYKQANAVALPNNSFSQEFAVINSTGVRDLDASGKPVDPPSVVPTDNQGNPLPVFDASGRVTPEALAANLRAVDNQAPKVTGQTLENGVFIPSSDGVNITGAGIYVSGDASDAQVYADTNGDQVYVISQKKGNSTTTTTVRVDYTHKQTTISSGSQTVTYNGVPTDKSNDPTAGKTDASKHRPGVSLYVRGSIDSLRGGKDTSTGQNLPAIASQTALTITAERNIRVTGDLKYADPVANSDGTPVTNISSVKNVLGIFTNDGNVFLDAKSQYVSGPGLGITMEAAFCVFDSNTTNNGSQYEGGITSYTGSGHQTPGSNDRIRMVGSDVEKRNSSVDYNYGDTYFDVRFSGGAFRPPFFPGTKYSLNVAPVLDTITISTIDTPASTAMSWFVDNK